MEIERHEERPDEEESLSELIISTADVFEGDGDSNLISKESEFPEGDCYSEGEIESYEEGQIASEQIVDEAQNQVAEEFLKFVSTGYNKQENN